MSDIVSDMSREMNLSPQMIDSLQQQQANYGMPQPNGMMQPPMGMTGGMQQAPQLSAEQQMAIIQQARQQELMASQQNYPQDYQQQQPQHQQYQHQRPQTPESSDTSSSLSSEELSAPQDFGIKSDKSFLDSLLENLKAPITVIIIFVLFNMPWIDELLAKFTHTMVMNNAYGYLGYKALLAGVLYFIASYFLKE